MKTCLFALFAALLIACAVFASGCRSGVAPRIPAMKYGEKAPFGQEASVPEPMPLKEAPEEMPEQSRIK